MFRWVRQRTSWRRNSSWSRSTTHTVICLVIQCVFWLARFWRGALQDIALPGSWNDRARSPLHECSRSPLNSLEKLNGLQRWSPSWSGLEFQGVPKRGEKPPHCEIAAQPVLVRSVICWACELPDSGHGSLQVLCWNRGVDALEQCDRILCLIEDDVTGLGQAPALPRPRS